MYTTYKEVIFNIKNLRQAGRQSQDNLLSDSQYGFIIDQYRTQLIGQEYAKRKSVNPIHEQTLTVKFQRIRDQDRHDLKVLRAIDLPRVIQLANRPYYTGVRTSLLAPSITRSTSIRIKNDVHSPLTGNSPRYFPVGDDLYLVTPDPIEKLMVSGIFERPFEVWKMDPRFNPFDPYNFPYPIAMNMLDTLYKMMTEAELRLSMIVPNDVDADGQQSDPPSSIPRSKPVAQDSQDSN